MWEMEFSTSSGSIGHRVEDYVQRREVTVKPGLSERAWTGVSPLNMTS